LALKKTVIQEKVQHVVSKDILNYFHDDEIIDSKIFNPKELHLYIELVHPSDITEYNAQLTTFLTDDFIKLHSYYWDILDVLHNNDVSNIFIEGPCNHISAARMHESVYSEYANVIEIVSLFKNAKLPKDVLEEEIKKEASESGAFYFYFSAFKPEMNLWTAESSILREEVLELYEKRNEIITGADKYFKKGIQFTDEVRAYRKKALEDIISIDQSISLKNVKRGEVSAQNLITAVKGLGISKSVLFFGANHQPEIKEVYKNSNLSYAIIQPRIVGELSDKIAEYCVQNRK
jgi:hypothetical protein